MHIHHVTLSHCNQSWGFWWNNSRPLQSIRTFSACWAQGQAFFVELYVVVLQVCCSDETFTSMLSSCKLSRTHFSLFNVLRVRVYCRQQDVWSSACSVVKSPLYLTPKLLSWISASQHGAYCAQWAIPHRCTFRARYSYFSHIRWPPPDQGHSC